MMMEDRIRVGTLDEVIEQPKVVRGNNHNIVVFAENGDCFAVDNRCPHMGFPLDRGTVKNGILTCHWHQARFDLSSGCTFDLWADDVLKFDTWIDNDTVFVAADPTEQRSAAFYRRRLIQGIEQDVGLVQAKCLLSLLEGGADLDSIIEDVLNYATSNLNQISEGLTRLGCVANLYPYLSADVAYQSLFYAIKRIAQETASAVPHRRKGPLVGGIYEHEQLKSWLHQWVQTRHTDGTERTLLTGLQHGTPQEFADLVFSVASERLYADGGHLLESCNKAIELGTRTGVDQQQDIVPLLTNSLVQSRGREESTNWHHPIELVAPLAQVDTDLPDILAQNTGQSEPSSSLLAVLCGDDPLEVIEQLLANLRSDVSPERLAREVCYAAALRLARFATSNEVTDWFNPQHTFIFCHAASRAVGRSATPQVVRAVFQGALSSYMDRFLNVPPARLPSERAPSDLPEGSEALLNGLLELLDRRSNIDDAADLTAAYIRQGFPLEELTNTLTLATIREDLDFHTLQVLDAGVQQCAQWQDMQVVENIMVGVTRNLAAHCPTRRAGQQTARIAAKLQRGEEIYES
jgi:nitrite reductase/ring-hydroxylating ferredoxin subunit